LEIAVLAIESFSVFVIATIAFRRVKA